jgi:histidyl-tRNA synthetase
MKPGLPQGTRDFSAEVVRKRNYIFNTIRNVFELYGFQPLETPAMENLETLMGKYGEEGDKLIFRILDSGNPFSKDFFVELAKYFEDRHRFFEELKSSGEIIDNPWGNALFKLNPEVLSYISTELSKSKESGQHLSHFKNEISNKALRYDLTIPFARYVAMNYGRLSMPFKRYQIQPVWRGDKPQRGRYREFYQCDADVVGSKSLLNEVELTSIYSQVFQKLGIDVEIRINSRKILAALAEVCGGADKMMNITIAIDKLDKIGIDKVKEELLQRGLSDEQITTIESYLNINGSNVEKLNELTKLIGNTETGKQGIEEINYLLNFLPSTVINQLSTDFTLARGLNYYTGIIFEIKAKGVQMGSIGGGGRYDDLTGLFGVPNVPGVGISFGVDRIYDVMEELKLFPEEVQAGTQILFFNLGEAESKAAFTLMQKLRAKGVRCEIYHEYAKFDKQFKYADKKSITHAAIIGTKELLEGTCVIKNLKLGEQTTVKAAEIESFNF